MVISKDENLTKSHGRYLESRIIEMAGTAGRATLVNGTAPPLPPLPEPDVADMEYFLEQMQMMLPVLGFTFLQPRPTIDTVSAEEPVTSQSPIFVTEDVGTTATAKEIDGEFVVLKGSTVRKTGAPSWDTFPQYRELRNQLVADGKLIQSDSPEFLVFSEHVAFSSPSAAANRNGPKTWRVKGSKQTYGEWKEAKVKESTQ